jgi:hypothetical protein
MRPRSAQIEPLEEHPMSHHLDSPIARQDVRLDISDVYLFRGERGTVFVMNVGHSLAGQDVHGFQPEAMY